MSFKLNLRAGACPFCHQTAEVTDLRFYFGGHYCDKTEQWWYTNGLMWSNDPDEIVQVSRVRSP